MFKKVVIWGHKRNHTHRYVHRAYYRAFKALGYDTYHFDDNEYWKLKFFDFENTLFLTEDQAQKHIPLIKSAKYILHHVKLEKYDERGMKYINLANYLKDCSEGISAYHKENTVEKVGELCYWDKKTKTVYQPWATDLLPDEIDTDKISLFDDSRKIIHYIGGSNGDNKESLQRFSEAAHDHGIKFVAGNTVGIEESHQLVRDSYITVDIRGPWHIECGYIPCRVFKNLSYGKFIGVNSPHVREIFGDYVAYETDPYKLFDVTVDAYRNMDTEKMKEAMEWVRNNHTYITRAKNLLKLVEAV